jgi:hypothetical protein
MKTKNHKKSIYYQFSLLPTAEEIIERYKDHPEIKDKNLILHVPKNLNCDYPQNIR